MILQNETLPGKEAREKLRRALWLLAGAMQEVGDDTMGFEIRELQYEDGDYHVEIHAYDSSGDTLIRLKACSIGSILGEVMKSVGEDLEWEGRDDD